MIIAYMRVSTVDKQSFDRQKHVIESSNYKIDKWIEEKVSGTQKKRKGLSKLLEIVREGDLVVTESLSRLGRNTKNVLELLEELEGRGVQVVLLKEGIDTRTPVGKLLVTILAAVDQMERDTLVERVNHGLEAAKKKGSRFGRPRVPTEKLEYAEHLYNETDKDGNRKYTIKEVAEKSGIGKSTFYNYINAKKDREVLNEGTD